MFERETQAGGEAKGVGEADPGTLGSCPQPKVDAPDRSSTNYKPGLFSYGQNGYW